MGDARVARHHVRQPPPLQRAARWLRGWHRQQHPGQPTQATRRRPAHARRGASWTARRVRAICSAPPTRRRCTTSDLDTIEELVVTVPERGRRVEATARVLGFHTESCGRRTHRARRRRVPQALGAGSTPHRSCSLAPRRPSATWLPMAQHRRHERNEGLRSARLSGRQRPNPATETCRQLASSMNRSKPTTTAFATSPYRIPTATSSHTPRRPQRPDDLLSRDQEQ